MYSTVKTKQSKTNELLYLSSNLKVAVEVIFFEHNTVKNPNNWHEADQLAIYQTLGLPKDKSNQCSERDLNPGRPHSNLTP